jgi:hypothetical protein
VIKFISAQELKKSFSVYGHFYTITLKFGETIDCRSVLEIVTKDTLPANIDRLSTQPPDAIFIMMNPGSSKPLEKVNNTIKHDYINQLEISLLPTKPDTTQYQVMRLMRYCNWNHVRVLNISDMRDPKSGKFVQRYVDLEKGTGFTAHSIFDDERTIEVNLKLKRKKTAPIVCAWGVSDDLDPLIDRCLGKIGDQLITGLLKNSNKYYHPLPTLQKAKVEWVDKMVMRLKDQI